MRCHAVFIFKSIFLLYSAGSGVNRVQVLFGTSVILLYFVQEKNVMLVW